MKNKKSDIIRTRELRQSISWECITKGNWKKLNALEGHCILKRSRSKNRNINKEKERDNLSDLLVNVEASKKRIKALKIKGGLQPSAGTHTAFIVHAGNSTNQLNKEEAQKYFYEVIQWLKKNLNGTLLHYSMHFDETTPHVHIMFENLAKTEKGNFCSFRSLMKFLNQPKKNDREGLEIFVRSLHREVSQKFGFLEPRHNQEVRTLDEYKLNQKKKLKEGIEALKQDKGDIEKELLKQQQEQEEKEQELSTLRAQKNNLTIERTRTENIQKKTIEQVKKLQNLEQELKELREQELKEITQLRDTKKQKKELLKQQQEQELKEMKLRQEEQLRELKQNQKKQLLKQQQEQEEKEQELRQQEEQLKQQEEQLRKKKEENLRKWNKAKEAYRTNFSKLKQHWEQKNQDLKHIAERKVNEIIENLLEENSIDNMIEKEIKLLNSITIKLEEATTKEQKIELIENIMKVKKSKIMRLKNSKDKNKNEIIEEIKKEQKEIKKAKRELTR